MEYVIENFEDVFNRQVRFQKFLLRRLKEVNDRKGLTYSEIDKFPIDSPEWFSYHALAMMEEMGELLKSDKRWKTHRNDRYEKDEKLDELADVFITMLNLAIFSGFTWETLLDSARTKIHNNFARLQNENENEKEKQNDNNS